MCTCVGVGVDVYMSEGWGWMCTCVGVGMDVYMCGGRGGCVHE